ncbi:Uncharacterised protein [Segatella copri]|nr:Uncharacterised protein [Segatella copri]
MQGLGTLLSQHYILHHLKIFGNSSSMSVNTAYQFYQSTSGFTLGIHHRERCRNLTNLHCIYRTGNLGR